MAEESLDEVIRRVIRDELAKDKRVVHRPRVVAFSGPVWNSQTGEFLDQLSDCPSDPETPAICAEKRTT
jgi:hypothetical protein